MNMSASRVDADTNGHLRNDSTSNCTKVYEFPMERGLVTPLQFDILRSVLIVVISVISSWGVLSNVTNIYVFSKIGIKDSVTLAFVYQSVFDLLALFLSLINMAAVSTELLENYLKFKLRLQPYIISLFCGNIRRLSYISSVLTTAFLALTRCMCVFRPLSFRTTFTTLRTHIFIVCCVFVSALISFPIFFTVRFSEVGPTVCSYSRLVIVITQEYQSLSEVKAVTSKIFLTFGTQFVVTFCLLVLTKSLRDASRARAEMTSSKIPSTSDPPPLTGKELQAVKQVALLATIFVVCNTPQVILAVIRLIFPEFNLNAQYQFTYMSCMWCRGVFEAVNTSANFFVYFNFNSNFRAILASKFQ